MTAVAFAVPAEVAFDYLIDPRHRPEWQSSLRRVELVDDRVAAVSYTEPAADLQPAKASKTFVAGA